MHKLKTTLISTFFLSFFSTSLNAQSLYWTDTVNEKLENLQTFDKSLAIATKLVNASVSGEHKKVWGIYAAIASNSALLSFGYQR